MEKIAIIAYGDGGELGKFDIFADTLYKELNSKYSKVVKEYTNRDSKFFNLIESTSSGEKIAELHIFSHAIGAGLFLGYKDITVQNMREATWQTAVNSGRKVTYHEAVRTEVGAVQTDDFKIGTLTGRQAGLRSKYANDAFIKIWGCNSGVSHWVYSDNGVIDPADTSEAYYWRAFNSLNTPKPSIAKALSSFFNVKVYGAKSGASIEVNHNRTWISSRRYKNTIGNWPSGSLPHRLTPDAGPYHEFTP